MSDDEFHDFSDGASAKQAARAQRSANNANANSNSSNKRATSAKSSTDAACKSPVAAAAPAPVAAAAASSPAAPEPRSILTSIPIGIGAADNLVESVDFEGIPPPEADSEDLSVVIDQTFNVTSRQFFELFLADRAIFPFSEFHHLRGDKDCRTTPWRLLKASDSPDAAATLAADPRLTAGTV